MRPFREIHTTVARVLVESLGVDEDDVIPSATLQGDLGAESIDFLDIVFRLERVFEIKIPQGELFPDSILGGQADLVEEGRSPIGVWSSCGRGCLMPTSTTSSATVVSAPSPIFSRSGCSAGMSNGSSVPTAGR
jgi:acyl carrier protein